MKLNPSHASPPDKDINHANRIILANPIFQAFRKQCALPAIHPLNKALHPIPPQIVQESSRKNHIDPRVFTHGVIPGSSHIQALGISSPRNNRAGAGDEHGYSTRRGVPLATMLWLAIPEVAPVMLCCCVYCVLMVTPCVPLVVQYTSWVVAEVMVHL
jgi:hypothetical protein